MSARETSQANGQDSPGVIVFPPVLYLGTLFLGLFLQFLWPLHLFSTGWLRIGGAIPIVAGGITAYSGRKAMLRGGTNILPNKPALAIVTDGPFRFTRNPLYIGNAAVYLGLVLVFNSVWLLALFVPMLVVIDRGIIRREERYLEAKFGEDYLAYKSRVRRWL